MEEIQKRFKDLKEIGRGAFSKVYKAFDTINERKCALKIYYREKIEDVLRYEDNEDIIKTINSIKNEAKILQICKSKNIVELYEYFEIKKLFIFVLELCDGDLNYFIEKNGSKTKITVIQKIFNDLNNAIRILFKNNIIHRDIKFSNILIKFEENGDFVTKLCDFGTSKICSFENKCSTHVGTIKYMAPEILKGDLYDYKCDLYSLGVCLYLLFFKVFPFDGINEHDLLQQMILFNPKVLKISGIESLDNLIRGLIEISPDKRFSMDVYLNHPFFKEDYKQITNLDFPVKSCEKKELKEDEKNNSENLEDIAKDKLKDGKNEQPLFIEKIKEIKNFAIKMHDIMEIANAYARKKESFQEKEIKKVKIANILYYDENIEKHLDDIHKDSDYFERKTPGAFILCTNILSLNFVMEEIKYKNESKSDMLFNLIVTGTKFQKVMNYLIENKYENYFQNICIYCMEIEKYLNLIKKYDKIKGVYNDPNKVIKFIEEVSSDKIKEFNTIKVISYFDYKDKYYERHEIISQFYGNLSQETYNKYSKKMKEYINSKEEKELKNEKEKLIKSFETFDLKKDLEKLHELMIHEYTKNTYYSNLNRWLRTFDTETYEMVSYYTARLMYALNCYALKSNLFFNDNKILYRGTKLTYISLLPYERLKGKIVLFSAFSSITEKKSIANYFSSRDKIQEIYKAKKYFSVIFSINNYFKANCISYGINIQDISKFQHEKEILFQPFSFFYVNNVKFDYEKYTVDIDLETIPKKEIFEEKIRKGGKIIYDKNTNLMVIEEKGKGKEMKKGKGKEIKKEKEIIEKNKDNANDFCNFT